MMTCITGTPGTGKSSLSGELNRRGHTVIHVVDTIEPYIISRDDERDTIMVDEERWAREFPPVDGIVEGHLAHYLSCDCVVILRCRPDILASRLKERGYSEEKITENVEAEALDAILQETVGAFPASKIHEIDTSCLEVNAEADILEEIISGTRSASFGSIDWSDYLLERL
jgi:adenylate kinase